MTTQKILDPEEIVALGARDPALLRMPMRDELFEHRAKRLEVLEPGHAMGGYLGLVAKLAHGQHRLLNAYPGTPPVPATAALSFAREHKMPPLAAQSWSRDPSWRAVLAGLCRDLRADLSSEGQGVIDRILAAPPDWIEDQANRILHQRSLALDTGTAVFIAGALQVYWTRMVTSLGAAAFDRIDVPNICPCCGSQPVASILRQGEGGMLRYLSCSLCAVEWNFVRIKCAYCDSTEGVQYYSVEGTDGKPSEIIKAETCDQCQTYLKVLYTDKDQHLEPVADDLASVALDFLMADTTTYARVNPNLALFPGEDDGSGGASTGAS